MKVLHTIAFILLVIGGLNWLLVGLVNGWDLSMYLGASIAKIVYILVGLSAVYLAVSHKKDCKCCVSSSSSSAM
jgi:uncharacterized membrane protein YuzA (DUF378 family)